MTLAVPVLALVVIVTFNVLQTRQAAQEAGEHSELASAVAGADNLLAMMQQERNLAGLHLVGSPAPDEREVDDLTDARGLTDSALADFETTISGRNSEIREAYGPVLETIAGEDGSRSGLEELRELVDGYGGELSFEATDSVEPVTFAGYGELIELLLGASAEASFTVDDVDLRRGAELIVAVGNQTNTIGKLLRELLFIQLGPDADGLSAPDEVERVISLYSQFQANNEIIRTAAVGPYGSPAGELFDENPQLTLFSTTVETALTTGHVEVGDLLGSTTSEDLGDSSYRLFSGAVADELQIQADALKTDADRLQNLALVLGLLILAATLAVTWWMARVIVGSLRWVAAHAATMADHLPGALQGIVETPLGEDVEVPQIEPLSAVSHDEIGDVADTFNRVQDTALNLAVEQAVLRRNIADSFVSLGQRNQDLLNRQLDLITQLERWETDHRALANLFTLDHLATRMRRNAECLMVLAGTAPPRRWAVPVNITDVIRAALGEVESYQRVSVPSVAPITVTGPAAADLAHLLAELIENALTFSVPDRPVEVHGYRAPGAQNTTGRYTITVTDHGLGLADDQLAQANRRLAGAEAFTVAPSRYLGHYVAGQLAAHHDIDVQLHRNADLPPAPTDPDPNPTTQGGLTAIIHVPPPLLSPPTTQPPHQPEVARPHFPPDPPPPPPALTPGPAPVGTVPVPGPTSGADPAPRSPDEPGPARGTP